MDVWLTEEALSEGVLFYGIRSTTDTTPLGLKRRMHLLKASLTHSQIFVRQYRFRSRGTPL